MFMYKPMYLGIGGKFNSPVTMVMTIGYQNAWNFINSLNALLSTPPLEQGIHIPAYGYVEVYNNLILNGYHCLCETQEQALLAANVRNRKISVHLLSKHNHNRSLSLEPNNPISKLISDRIIMQKALEDYQQYYPEFVSSADYTLVDTESEEYKVSMISDYIYDYKGAEYPKNLYAKYQYLVRSGELCPLWFDI